MKNFLSEMVILIELFTRLLCPMLRVRIRIGIRVMMGMLQKQNHLLRLISSTFRMRDVFISVEGWDTAQW